MKRFFLIFLFFLLLSSAWSQDQNEFQPKVFSSTDFYNPKLDTPIEQIGEMANFLPTNLPRVVTVGNKWWEAGDKYIPKNWPIPNHDLGIGEWFGWYLHDANRAKFGSAGQIDLFPVPDSVKALWKNQKANDAPTITILKWGTALDGMTFSRSATDMVVCSTTVWLGVSGQDLAVHIFQPVEFDGYAYQLGFVFDCNNHFYWKWKLPEKIEPPEQAPPEILQLPPQPPEQAPPKIKPAEKKKIFTEAALWGGYIGLNMNDGGKKRIDSRLQIYGQESSLTIAQDRQTSFWLNSTSEYWQEDNLNESLSPNWTTQTGFQFSVGPQNRFYLQNGVLKTGVNWGVRYAYDRSQQFLRPRINFEKYAVIGKFGFQMEADALLSIDKKWREEVYFGNIGIFYSPKYRTKYWLGLEYTNVKTGDGGYASSGTFLVAKWESVFGFDWLTLIGKYRVEQTNVNHIIYSDPPHISYSYTDNFDGVRWGIFAAIALKR